MLKYYWHLLRSVPGVFRGTWEGLAFWVTAMVAALAVFSPELSAAVQQRLSAWPRWYGLVALGVLVLYGLARANWLEIKRRGERITELEGELFERQVPDFVLALGQSISWYNPSEDVSAIVLAISLANRGAPSAALAWAGQYESETLNAESCATNLLDVIVVPVGAVHQVSITQADLIQSKTTEAILQGQIVHGRILLIFSGNRPPEIGAGKAMITVKCWDYTGRGYSAQYRGGSGREPQIASYFPTEKVQKRKRKR